MRIIKRLFGENRPARESPSSESWNAESEDFELIEPPIGGPVAANYRGKDRSCFIDKSGLKVIEVPYPYSGRSFSEGMCIVGGEGAGARYGFMNKAGEFIVDPSYDSANGFREGLAAVALDHHWGFIDKQGKTVIEMAFGEATSFSEGLAAVRLDGKWCFINHEGKIVIPPIDAWRAAPRFSEGLAQIRRDEKWGFIDKKGKVVIEPLFDEAGGFSHGLAAAKVGNQWGYIDKQGQWTIKPSFSRVGIFSESLALVYSMAYKRIGRYIDTSGNTVIDFEEWDEVPDMLGHFNEGLAPVKLNRGWGFIDRQGVIVIPIEYHNVVEPEFSEGLAEVKKGKQCCYINRRGDVIIETDANVAGDYFEGLASLTYFL